MELAPNPRYKDGGS